MFSLSQNDGGGSACGCIRIAIFGVIDTLVRGDEYAAVVEHGGETDAVGAGIEIHKLVPASAISGGGADGIPRCVEEGNRHALDARFTAVLEVIAVQVLPDVVAEAGFWIDVGNVQADFVFPCGEGR